LNSLSIPGSGIATLLTAHCQNAFLPAIADFILGIVSPVFASFMVIPSLLSLNLEANKLTQLADATPKKGAN